MKIMYFVMSAKVVSETRPFRTIISSNKKATELRPPPSYKKSFEVSGKIRRSQNEFRDFEKSFKEAMK